MTPAEAESLLAAAEARAEAATPGPWEPRQDVTSGGGFFGLRERVWAGPSVVIDGGGMTDENAAFIAAARADVPALIALAREQMAGREAAERDDERLISQEWERKAGAYEQAAEDIAKEATRQRERATAAEARLVIERSALAVAEEAARRAEAEVARLCEERDRLRATLRDFRDNWDCDADSHRYGTTCRACEAKRVLGEEVDHG